MPQIIRSFMLIVIIIGIVSIGTDPGEAKYEVATNDGVSIHICDARRTGSAGFGPQLVVLIVNHTKKPISIDRHLYGIPIARHSSLRAHIVDEKTGVVIGARAKFKPVERHWRESDLVTLEQNMNYGPILDLRDFFSLKQGRSYRVKFEYVGLPPIKVGTTETWRGSVTAQTVVITVP